MGVRLSLDDPVYIGQNFLYLTLNLGVVFHVDELLVFWFRQICHHLSRILLAISDTSRVSRGWCDINNRRASLEARADQLLFVIVVDYLFYPTQPRPPSQ
ncbi:uncharacterized protein FPRO_14814 [Fusarium proliferatum ET1]|uniref:Uncharacterized protein n=1 Tax=Fusarium proliferatum (strain ET1) TaxID=1227346 RepID=A0A1L7WAU9_FUSPR|nr:uncharacterized protein FPRO_14814 [Fusarium proliferatum ET1]CZR49708.1 uncharacterized protein FPRO_14814 [Fusarium proliferatum ET1]